MLPEEQRIARNVAQVMARMAAAARRAGRDPSGIRLVAVTKSEEAAAIPLLRHCGIEHVGENRPASAQAKLDAVGRAGCCWHMIGHVQRRKARDVAALFDRVDSDDRIELAEALQRRCDELDKTMPVLLEVNVSGEAQKQGLAPGELPAAIAAIRGFGRLRVEGLMTMAPFDAPEAVLRGVFGGLKRMADAHGLAVISMGMTDDFEVAIEEGATEVRIGRALFA